jgi:transposase-like protein
MKQSKYSNEEKLKIIAEAKSSGNIAATAKKYSISDVCIHGWIRKFNKAKPEQDIQSELKKLKQQLADKELENSILKDLLKKTVQVWTHEEKSLMNISPGNILKQKF